MPVLSACFILNTVLFTVGAANSLDFYAFTNQVDGTRAQRHCFCVVRPSVYVHTCMPNAEAFRTGLPLT